MICLRLANRPLSEIALKSQKGISSKVGCSRSGVLILSQNLPINEAIEAIILVWEASTAEEWINQIMTFPF
jgi:hypothetical protein